MSTGLHTAPTWRRRSCATTPRASAASSSIRSCRRPTPSPQTGGTRAPASTTSSRPARRKRPATPPIRISKQTFTRTGQQTRGRAADDDRQRPGHRQRRQSRPRRRGTGRLAAQPELCRALAPGRAGSDRWARRRPPRFHRGDRQGSGSPGAATRSGCPCPRLRAVLWRQLSRRLPVRDAGGPRRGRPEQRFRTIRRRCKARASAAGPMSTRTAATSGRSPPPRQAMHQPVASSHSDAPDLRQLRYADVARRGEGRRAANLSNATIISIPGIGHFVAPQSPCAQTVDRLVPRRSRRPRHILRRRTEAAELRRFALTRRGPWLWRLQRVW